MKGVEGRGKEEREGRSSKGRERRQRKGKGGEGIDDPQILSWLRAW